MEIYINDSGRVSGWYLNNWPQGDDWLSIEQNENPIITSSEEKSESFESEEENEKFSQEEQNSENLVEDKAQENTERDIISNIEE